MEDVNEKTKIIRDAFEQVIDKGLDSITEEDVSNYNNALALLNEITERINKLQKEKNDIESKLDVLNTMRKKYSLVDEKDFFEKLDFTPEDEPVMKSRLTDLNEQIKIVETLNIEELKEIEKKTSLIIDKYNRQQKLQEDIREHRKILEDVLFSEDKEPTVMLIEDISDSHYGVEDQEKHIPITGKMKKLMELGFLKSFRESVLPRERWERGGNYRDDSILIIRAFLPYEQCELEGKQAIREYEQRLQKMIESDDPKYEQKGIISIPVYDEFGRGTHVPNFKFEMTPKELAELGISYTEVEWKSLEQIKEEEEERNKNINSKNISELSKKNGLTKTEVGIAGKILESIRNFFRGR